MIVRPPTRGELERAAEIGKIAFQSDSIDSWINSYNWIADNRDLDHLIVVEDEGRLIASMLCTPGDAMFGEDVLPLCAVGGVATLPDDRRKGAAGEMMKYSVRLLHEKGYHTSALWPFSYRYYRKFGWELAGESRKYRLPSKLASQLGSSEGTRPALESDLPAITELIEWFGHRYNCVTVRDRLWWSCIEATYGLVFDGNEDVKTRRTPWVHETDGNIDGYVFLSPEEDDTDEKDHSTAIARELVARTGKARFALLSRLAEIGRERIEFCTPTSDEFMQELDDPYAITTRVEPGFMLRVVNAQAAMELRRFDPTLRGRVGFAVDDPVLGRTEFSIDVENGRASRAKAEASERLSMDVQTFSQIFSGYMRPERAFALGKIETTSRETLDFVERLSPKVMPFRSTVEIG